MAGLPITIAARPWPLGVKNSACWVQRGQRAGQLTVAVAGGGAFALSYRLRVGRVAGVIAGPDGAGDPDGGVE